MFSAFQTFGKLGAIGKAIASAWSPLALWPNGINSAGMWISPRDLTSQWADYTGTTPVATPGTVADSSNPVGLALDIRAGATVLTDPGNHMLQSTSVDRPLLSARVNLLTKTEDFADAVWGKNGASSATTNSITDNTSDFGRCEQISQVTTGVEYKLSIEVKADTSSIVFLQMIGGVPDTGVYFELSGGGSSIKRATTATPISKSITLLSDGWYRCAVSQIANATGNVKVGISPSYRADMTGGEPIGALTGTVLVRNASVVISNYSALAYQRVNTDADYDASVAPTYQKYDGVDDGMATAAFSAGTLTSGMDCMIAVRRDSAASCVAGLYNGIADATKFFGMAESASGSGCVGSGAGTPTVWVDNTQLTGGTAVTRGTLHTALTVGDWHILEFRNLDLSTWAAAGFGLYTSYLFPGPRGDILLYPSTASTEDKDAARQLLADYYGVTLP